MSYYCIKCKVGNEEKARKELEDTLISVDPNVAVCFSKREINEKQKDKSWKSVIKPLLPGYLLVSTYIDAVDLRALIKANKYASYILRYNAHMYELQAGDKAYAEWIFNNEGLLKPSKVLLEPGERIKVIDGPLLGMEGKIVRVKKRERRVYIELPFEETCNTISLSIDIVSSI